MSLDVQRSKREGQLHPKYRHEEVEAKSVKRYGNCFLLLRKLSKDERDFLDWLTEQMDENNLVANNKKTRDYYNNFLKKIGCNPLSDSALNKFFSKYKDLTLMDKYKKRGLFQISPLYFFAGTEKAREDLIRGILERPWHELNNQIRHKELKKPRSK